MHSTELRKDLGHPQVPGYKGYPMPKTAWRVLVSEKGTREYDRLRVLSYPTSASEHKAPQLPLHHVAVLDWVNFDLYCCTGLLCYSAYFPPAQGEI